MTKVLMMPKDVILLVEELFQIGHAILEQIRPNASSAGTGFLNGMKFAIKASHIQRGAHQTAYRSRPDGSVLVDPQLQRASALLNAEMAGSSQMKFVMQGARKAASQTALARKTASIAPQAIKPIHQSANKAKKPSNPNN